MHVCVLMRLACKLRGLCWLVLHVFSLLVIVVLVMLRLILSGRVIASRCCQISVSAL